jgi:hypothetical protein
MKHCYYLILACILLFVTGLSCIYGCKKNKDAGFQAVSFAPGTPLGNPIEKMIGPSGGSITTPDKKKLR